jgi:hypothetical protein
LDVVGELFESGCGALTQAEISIANAATEKMISFFIK